ncbi:MAG: hypothetical protein KGN84_04750 [Acidobacteriota bacterium]|nr:hypothetical protein [Acidobacteriota bacterium]
MKWLALFTLGAILHPSVRLKDVNGVEREPLKVEKGHVGALFFVAHDCPIANYYSHEIRRICDQYGPRGLSCSVVYVEPTLTDAAAAKHAREYGHGDYPKIVDRGHELVASAGATITPQVVLVRDNETIAYRGRIDNYYAALGRPRSIVTRHDLRDTLDELFAGKPVTTPETQAVGCYIPELSAYSR